MPVRGLTIILASVDPDQLRSVLGLAATVAALGGGARLFLDGPSVRLLATPIAHDRDPDFLAAGLPTLAELVDTAIALGVTIMLCQSGVALVDLGGGRIDSRFQTGGMTGVIASLGDDRLVVL